MTVFLLCSTAAVGLSQFGISANAWIYFDDSNEQLVAFRALEDTYSKSENILIVIQPRDKQVFTKTNLEFIVELTKQAWLIPNTIRVDSLSNFQHISGSEDELVVGDLIRAPNHLSDKQLQALKDFAVHEPALVERLISKDASTTGILLTLKFSQGEHSQALQKTVAAVKSMVDAFKKNHPDYRIGLTGLAMMSYTEAWATKRDLRNLLPPMYVLIGMGLLVLLRSFTGSLITLIIVSLSTVAATGLISWFSIKLNSASIAAPVIIFTLAIADCVHLLTKLFDKMSQGQSKLEAMLSSMRINAFPVFLTSLTTSIGFASLNFSDSPPFRDLGNITCVGVWIAWILAMSLLPALVALLPITYNANASFLQRFATGFGPFIVNQRKTVFVVVTICMLIVVTFLSRLSIDDRFVEFFEPDIPFRADTDFTMQNLTGIYALEFSIAGAGAGGIAEPNYLNRLDQFATWLREQPHVRQVYCYCDVMKRLNKAMHSDQENYYRIPDSRELAAQYLLLYEMSLPYGLDLNSQITVDKSATRMVVVLDNVPTKTIRQIAAQAESWLRSHTPAYMHASATGSSILFSHLTERNIRSMLRGTIVAFTLIAIVLMLTLRNMPLGLISLIPNFLPIFLTFGVWALFHTEIGIIASVITASSLGLIVDDTVHILSHYNHARRRGGVPAEAAIIQVYQQVGPALIITSIVLVLGFSILGISSFKIDSDFGLLTSLALVFAILMDFLYLPPLLIYFRRWY